MLAFVALAKHLNVTRAADSLNITQQGLSGQLAKLRDLTGDELLVRADKGMRLTPKALELLPKVEEVINGIEQLMHDEEFIPAAVEGRIVIAATDYAIALLAPNLIRTLNAQAPNLQIRVRHIEDYKENQGLNSDEVDLILSVPEFSSDTSRAAFLFDENYLGFARPGHPIFHHETVDLDLFCSYDHLLVSPFRGDAFGATDRALEKLGRKRRIAITVPDFSIVETILQKSDLVSVLPKRLAENMSGRLQSFVVPVELEPFKLYAYWPAHLQRDPLNLWLRTIVAECAELIEPQ